MFAPRINMVVDIFSLLLQPELFDQKKSGEKLLMKCSYCDHIRARKRSEVVDCIRKKRNVFYCSKICESFLKKTRYTKRCEECKKEFIIVKHLEGVRKFCSKSCAAVYNNTHKKYGTKISKLERWIQTKLSAEFTDLSIHYNRKDAIDSELDIYIPSLKLAFELNGIFHYEPIYSSAILKNIQNNDDRKFQACLEKGISLCIINTSEQKHFKESTSQKYLDVIRDVISKSGVRNGIQTHII